MPYDPAVALAHLRSADPVMAAIIERVGPFAMREDSPDPFRSLARAIIFQQLSGAAAGTIYGRLVDRFSSEQSTSPQAIDGSAPAWDGISERFPAPLSVLAIAPDELRAVGLSRQKATYLHALASHFVECEACPVALYSAPDEAVISHLTAIPGVGRWTAEMFLLFHLRRPDVLPVNDVGINRAIRNAYGLAALPSPAEVASIGTPWRPFASVACWYLWRSEDTTVPA